MQKASLLIACVFLLAFSNLSKDPIKVYLIGDSTMSIKAVKAFPETGWGMPFVYFFDSTVVVDNRAKNGRSTGSFLAENRWQPVYDSLAKDDYVLIQFGHNDEVETKKTYTTPDEFRTNLVRYVTETREKQAHPILITPVARRRFDEAGNVYGTHDQYAEIVRSVAQEQQVPLIDLDKKSQALMQELGVEQSKMLFNWLNPGEHPNYPDGREDNTHFNELGARIIAQLVLAEIRALDLDLKDRIVGENN